MKEEWDHIDWAKEAEWWGSVAIGDILSQNPDRAYTSAVYAFGAAGVSRQMRLGIERADAFRLSALACLTVGD